MNPAQQSGEAQSDNTGGNSGGSPEETAPLSRRFNIEKDPLHTGEEAPRISWREQAAMLLPEWVRHRAWGAWFVVAILLGVAWLTWTAISAAIRVFESRLPPVQ